MIGFLGSTHFSRMETWDTLRDGCAHLPAVPDDLRPDPGLLES